MLEIVLWLNHNVLTSFLCVILARYISKIMWYLSGMGILKPIQYYTFNYEHEGCVTMCTLSLFPLSDFQRTHPCVSVCVCVCVRVRVCAYIMCCMDVYLFLLDHHIYICDYSSKQTVLEKGRSYRLFLSCLDALGLYTLS